MFEAMIKFILKAFGFGRGKRKPLALPGRAISYQNKSGYIVKRDIIGRRYFEHRLIAEEILGRKLKDDEVVHHINKITNDNRPENLCIMLDHAHRHYHRWYKWKKENNCSLDRASSMKKLRGLNGIPLQDIISPINKKISG